MNRRRKKINLKRINFLKLKQVLTLVFLVIWLFFFNFFFSKKEVSRAEINLGEEEISDFLILQSNSFLPISNPANPEKKVINKVKVIVTAYSSSIWETDGNPYLTAAGTKVREGIVANNKYPLGTKIRIPEIYGDKIFVIEDRMNWKKGNYHVDIWFPSYWEAKSFGAKRTYIEILES